MNKEFEELFGCSLEETEELREILFKKRQEILESGEEVPVWMIDANKGRQ